MVEAIEKLIGSSYMLGLIHAEEENPERKINAADETEIPAVPFTEAIQFLKSKVPMSKTEWNKLEPKLRFRAFTVAKLGEAEIVNKAKQILVSALEKGGSYSSTWEELKKKVNVDTFGIKPGYWENVFRTNTQTAYIAGKLQQYENTGVAAYQLMVIEDDRTSKICRHLLTESGYGMILPVGHPFWKKYGFPPYHFQCRTSIRAVWPSQIGKIGNNVENPSMKSLTKFKVQDGFGGNPLERGSWWEMTDSMKKIAVKFGVMDEMEAEKNMIFSDFNKYQKLLSEKGLALSSETINLDEEILKDLNDVLSDIDIPEITESITVSAPVTVSIASMNYKGELKLNLIYMMNKEKLLEELTNCVSLGLYPKNCNNPKSVLYHELFGHGAERFLLKHASKYIDKTYAWKNCLIAEDVVKEAIANIIKRNPSLSENMLRREICLNAIDSYSETMAYGLEDVYINKENAQLLSKEIKRVTFNYIRDTLRRLKK